MRRLGASLLLLLAAAVPARADAQAGALACGPGDMTATLNQALARGGTVELAAGTCLVSGSVTVPSHTVLRGAGAGRTVLRARPGATRAVLVIGGARQADGARDVEVSALTVDGGAGARGPRRSDAIWVPFGASAVRLHHLEATGAGDNGIEVNGSDVGVEDSAVHDNYTNGVYVTGKGNAGGRNVVRARGVRVLRNQVFHNSLAKAPGSGHAWDGIDIDPISQDCVVRGNTVRGNDIILFENADVVAFSSGHRVLDNTVEDSPGNGVVVEGPQRDFEVSGNRLARIVRWGIVTNGPSRDGVIRGNTIGPTTEQGILVKNTTPLAGAPYGIEISGNRVMTAASGPGHVAIAARQGADHLRIEGNVFVAAPGAPPSREPLDLRLAGPDVTARDNR